MFFSSLLFPHICTLFKNGKEILGTLMFPIQITHLHYKSCLYSGYQKLSICLFNPSVVTWVAWGTHWTNRRMYTSCFFFFLLKNVFSWEQEGKARIYRKQRWFFVTLRKDQEEEISVKEKEDKIKQVGANPLEKNGDRRIVLGIELYSCFLS